MSVARRLETKSHRSRFYLVILSTAIAFILSPGHTVFSAQIKLSWDPNTEPDLAGYNVYYGNASRAYGVPVNAGNATTYTLTGLTSGQTYYVAVTAYDTSGNESGYSNEVSGIPQESPQYYTVTTNPGSLQFLVDGTTYAAPQTFSWTPGSSHALSAPSPQSGANGTNYVYSSWSDGQPQSHTVTASSPGTTYTAYFTSNSETISIPTVIGSITGIIGFGLPYTSIGASSDQGHPVEYQFDWKGDGSDLSPWGPSKAFKTWAASGMYQVRAKARCSIHTAAVSEWSEGLTVSVIQLPVSSTVTTSPTGLQVTVDGVDCVTPCTFNWAPGSHHTLSTNALQPGVSGVRYALGSWSDGETQNHSITAPSSATTYTANFLTQYSLTTSSNPSEGGKVMPTGVSWYNSGQSVSLSATASDGYSFSSWSGAVSGSAVPESLIMNGPKAVMATFLPSPSFRIHLKAGLNLVSFPVISGQVPVSDLLSSISGKYETAFSYEACDSVEPWKVHDPLLPESVNDLQFIDNTMGLWISATEDAELEVDGIFPARVNIPLCTGWNLISYPGKAAKPLEEALSSISGKYESIYTYKPQETSDPWKMWFGPTAPPGENDLSMLEPGVGYWIMVTEDCTLFVTN